MLLQLLTLTAATGTLALPQAIPNSDPPTLGRPFGIEATGEGIVNIDLRARAGRIYIGGPQSPTCIDNARQDFATWVTYSDKTLYLYKHTNPPQQVWVDASGMGQGITGFSDIYYPGNTTSAPRNASFEGFEVDETDGSVVFGETGAKACPTGEEGVWSLWFSGSETPGFQEGCVDVRLRGYDAPARVACEYTTE